MSNLLKKPSNSLICPERIAHIRSFAMSDLSDSLTVAHLSWANRSHSLICPEPFEQMSEFPTLASGKKYQLQVQKTRFLYKKFEKSKFYLK